MGCNVKEKSIRAARKHRHSSASNPKPPPPSLDLIPSPSPTPDLIIPNPNPNPNPISASDEAGWGYCTEDQLEELLLKNLDIAYKDALKSLIGMGYDESRALRALLANGHCYGSMDVLTNILQNAVSFLKSGDSAITAADSAAPSASAFNDLRHLQEYSLAGLVCLLQQVRPDLTRGDAMWCLLISELHVGRATSIEIPSSSCKFHDPKRKVVSVAARSRARLKNSEKDADVVATVLKSLENMSIEEEDDEKLEDVKKEKVMSLIRQIRDLEVQVKERKDWAQQKAMQAAKRLSNDLTELKVLRMEREENQRVKKGKQALEDTTMKRLSEMETALKKASGQVDRANAVVSRLQTENAEIKAEMEASKLSASESVTTCLEVAKREKKWLKRLLAWEKQKEKLQEEVGEERKKIVEMQQQLNEIRDAQKEAEVS